MVVYSDLIYKITRPNENDPYKGFDRILGATKLATDTKLIADAILIAGKGNIIRRRPLSRI